MHMYNVYAMTFNIVQNYWKQARDQDSPGNIPFVCISWLILIDNEVSMTIVF